MFLRNYCEWQRAVGISSAYTNESGSTASNVYTSLQNLAGNLTNHYLVGVNGGYSMFSYQPWGDAINRISIFKHSLSVRVGTGTTEVDEEDYCLDTDVTSSFSQIALSVQPSVSADGHQVVTISWTGTNTTSNNITIKEIGLVKSLPMFISNTIATSQLDSVSYENILIARHILEEPVTINAGDSGTITVKIEMF